MEFRFDHVHLYTTDPEGSAKWLADMFGGKLVRSRQSDGRERVDVALGGVLVYVSRPLPSLEGQRSGRGAGLDHFGMWVADVDAAVTELEKKGVKVISAPKELRPGVRGAFIEGPEGIVVEIAHRSAADFNPV